MKSTKRKSNFELSHERMDELSTPGNLQLFAMKIAYECNVSHNEVLKYFPKFCKEKLHQTTCELFRRYYLYGESIIKLRYIYNVSYSRIEKRIKTSEEKFKEYINELKENNIIEEENNRINSE